MVSVSSDVKSQEPPIVITIISILYCLILICGVLLIVAGWDAMVMPASIALSSIPSQSSLFGYTSRPEVRVFGRIVSSVSISQMLA